MRDCLIGRCQYYHFTALIQWNLKESLCLILSLVKFPEGGVRGVLISDRGKSKVDENLHTNERRCDNDGEQKTSLHCQSIASSSRRRQSEFAFTIQSPLTCAAPWIDTIDLTKWHKTWNPTWRSTRTMTVMTNLSYFEYVFSSNWPNLSNCPTFLVHWLSRETVMRLLANMAFHDLLISTIEVSK